MTPYVQEAGNVPSLPEKAVGIGRVLSEVTALHRMSLCGRDDRIVSSWTVALWMAGDFSCSSAPQRSDDGVAASPSDACRPGVVASIGSDASASSAGAYSP